MGPTHFRRFWEKTNTSSATEIINANSVILFMVLWIVALIIFAWNFNSKDDGFVIFSKVLVVSAAAYFTGGITGFIFGIPKTLQNPDRANNSTGSQASALGNSVIQNLFITNTSLEQISDWLTKIIVGVSLVNLRSVPIYLENLRIWLQKLFPGTDTSISAYALALLIFSSIVGFITFYIYTRVNLAAQFIKEAIDNSQLTSDVVNKASQNTAFKDNLINQLQNLPATKSE